MTVLFESYSCLVFFCQAESLQAEVEALKERVEELTLDLEIIQNEISVAGKKKKKSRISFPATQPDDFRSPQLICTPKISIFARDTAPWSTWDTSPHSRRPSSHACSFLRMSSPGHAKKCFPDTFNSWNNFCALSSSFTFYWQRGKNWQLDQTKASFEFLCLLSRTVFHVT